MSDFREEWLGNNAVIEVTPQNLGACLREVKRLRNELAEVAGWMDAELNRVFLAGLDAETPEQRAAREAGLTALIRTIPGLYERMMSMAGLNNDGVVESVDTAASKAEAARRAGSTPAPVTKNPGPTDLAAEPGAATPPQANDASPGLTGNASGLVGPGPSAVWYPPLHDKKAADMGDINSPRGTK